MENKATREEMKIEAIERMKLLKIHGNPIREFKEEDKLNLSENGGILYWLDDNEVKMVKDFEAKHGHMVYHVIKNHTEFGLLYAFIFVSKRKSEWKRDRMDLMQGNAFSYVENADDAYSSEFGMVGIRPQFGGLKRTY